MATATRQKKAGLDARKHELKWIRLSCDGLPPFQVKKTVWFLASDRDTPIQLNDPEFGSPLPFPLIAEIQGDPEGYLRLVANPFLAFLFIAAWLRVLYEAIFAGFAGPLTPMLVLLLLAAISHLALADAVSLSRLRSDGADFAVAEARVLEVHATQARRPPSDVSGAKSADSGHPVALGSADQRDAPPHDWPRLSLGRMTLRRTTNRVNGIARSIPRPDDTSQ